MAHRRRFSAEYKREAVAMLDAPGVSVSQIAADLGIGVTVLGRWRRELRQEHDQAFRGNGRPRDEELAQLLITGSPVARKCLRGLPAQLPSPTSQDRRPNPQVRGDLADAHAGRGEHRHGFTLVLR